MQKFRSFFTFLFMTIGVGVAACNPSVPPPDEFQTDFVGTASFADGRPITNTQASLCFQTKEEYPSDCGIQPPSITTTCFLVVLDANGKFEQTENGKFFDTGLASQGSFFCSPEMGMPGSFHKTNISYSASLDFGSGNGGVLTGTLHILGDYQKVGENPESGASILSGKAEAKFSIPVSRGDI